MTKIETFSTANTRDLQQAFLAKLKEVAALVATTNLKAARAAHRWFNNRSILSKVTRDGVTKIEVCVPHPSPSGEGPTQEILIAKTRCALRDLLPDGTAIEVIR